MGASLAACVAAAIARAGRATRIMPGGTGGAMPAAGGRRERPKKGDAGASRSAAPISLSGLPLRVAVCEMAAGAGAGAAAAAALAAPDRAGADCVAALAAYVGRILKNKDRTRDIPGMKCLLLDRETVRDGRGGVHPHVRCQRRIG